MSLRFSKHYTLEEARALLPDIRNWLDTISTLQERLAKLDLRLANLSSTGNDVGGDTVNNSIKVRSEVLSVIQEFAARGIQVKDLERGLIDFPAIKNGREVFLCWEKDEEDIQYWHDLESGFPGREPLD